MAIANTDVLFMLATLSGAAGDSTAQADKNQSLGKYVSTTQMGTGAGALFDDVTGTENANSVVDYRCVFVKNNHASQTATSVRVYFPAEVAGGTSVAIGVDPTAATAKGSAAAQAVQVANETTAPAGVAFSTAAVTDGAGLDLGSLAAGQVRAFWVRRTAGNTGPVAGDGATLSVSFDTPA